ncbi:MAG: LysR family transcriptional regulator [Opitutaceae bacterium]|jgi:DNA-binding transcriptional LysR family regulator
MELRHLEALVRVAQHGGFSAAAKSLSTTQPTISKAVRQLEHDCDAVLVNRLGGGAQLTEAGEVVVKRGAAMLAEREHLKAELAGLKGLATGRLRLGLPALGSSILFAPLVAKFKKLYPQITIELQQHGSEHLEDAVRSGEIELGATLNPVPDEFGWQLVRDEPIVALLPAGHPLRGRKTVKLEDLAANPFIFFEQGFVLNGLIEAACRKRGLTLVEAARSGSADFIVALVAAGLGLALLPRLEMATRTGLSVEAVEVDEPDLRWKLGLIWRQGAALSPPAERWLALVREQLEPALTKTAGRSAARK